MNIKMLSASVVLIMTFCAHARFTYDATSGTVTDASCGWTFKATCKNTDELTLDGTGCSYSGMSPCSLDLTEITDAGGKTYKAVSFKVLPAAAKPYLTEFIAPDCQKIEGEGCFRDCKELVTVKLNETAGVTYLGSQSFMSCTKLENFTPRKLGVDYLYANTFRLCSSLDGGFDLPSCRQIRDRAFGDCVKLEWISAPELTMVGEAAFSGCSSLSSVSVQKVSQICNSAFFNCSSLSDESLKRLLPGGIEYLGSNAIANQEYLFSGCTVLTGPVVWDFPSLKTNVVAKGMFKGCSKLKEVTIVSDVAEIKDYAFENIAPEAAVYMPINVPAVYGIKAVSRSAAPYPRIYLKDNHDDWLAIIGEKHQVLLRGMVNNPSWTSTTTKTDFRKMRIRMSSDETMCTVKKSNGEITEVTLLDKNILAFVAFEDESYSWVLKMPETGFCVIVR